MIPYSIKTGYNRMNGMLSTNERRVWVQDTPQKHFEHETPFFLRNYHS
jgi:hypothetical protein